MKRAKKHTIGKRERASLENELTVLSGELVILSISNEEGFKPFYDNVLENGKKVERKQEIEQILRRGFYHVIYED